MTVAGATRPPSMDRPAASATVSFTMHGIGVSGGIAIGHAHLFAGMSAEVDHYDISGLDVVREQRRYDRAVKEVKEELAELAESVRHSTASELAPFVKVHLMLLEDAAFTDAPRDIIREQHCNAEWALRIQLDELMAQFTDIEDLYLREREADVRQVAERVLEALAGSKRRMPVKPVREDASILVARDLSPADVILFREHPFAAFITDLGGATSHTAIVARSMNMPAIVALHHSRSLIHEDELIVVDGTQGVVIVNPDRHVLAEYRLKQNQARLERDKLKRLRTAAAATLDGTPVQLQANIELPSDVEAVKVPVHEPPRPARRGRAVRGLPRGGRGPEGHAGHDPHARPGRRQVARHDGERRGQSGAGPARDPLLPRRAPGVQHAAARDPARVAPRQGAHPAAHAVDLERDHPGARGGAARQGAAARRRREIRRVRPGRRHDRGARRRDRAADVHPQARFPLGRHQ